MMWDFVNRQLERMRLTYQYFATPLDVGKLLMWGIMTVGITGWFNLQLSDVLIVCCIVMFLFIVIGWQLQKHEVFSNRAKQGYKMESKQIFELTTQYSAAKFAVYLIEGLGGDSTSAREDLKKASDELGMLGRWNTEKV